MCFLAAGLPLGLLTWNTLRGRPPWDPLDPHLIFCAIACVLWRWRPDGVRVWSILAPVGAISYGLYILQRPAQWFVQGADWLPSGTPASFLVRLIVALGLTVLAAWWTEKKLQPWLRHRIIGARNR
jgi:peptidoglycan/LPS O-acetylase OafA/YrhL